MSALSPDADRDVLVHAITLVDALTGAEVGRRWTVWVGREPEGSFDAQGEALALAEAIAAERSCLAWLLTDGRPPVPIAGGDS